MKGAACSGFGAVLKRGSWVWEGRFSMQPSCIDVKEDVRSFLGHTGQQIIAFNLLHWPGGSNKSWLGKVFSPSEKDGECQGVTGMMLSKSSESYIGKFML